MTNRNYRPSRASPLRIGMVALVIGGSPAVADARFDQPPASVTNARPMTVSLISAQPHQIPADIHGSARLLTHTMPAINGGTTRATTLLFVPIGNPPAGGWPIVGWIHGTTSTGKKDCALGVERHAGEAAGLEFLGTVAAAPYTTVPGIGADYAVEARAVSVPATLLNARVMVQMQGASMTTALLAQSPDFDPGAIMGEDLKVLMPAFRNQCSVGAFNLVKAAVARKGESFRGVRPDWSADPRMHAFLAANDPGEMETLTLRQPALIVQGTDDNFVSARLARLVLPRCLRS